MKKLFAVVGTGAVLSATLLASPAQAGSTPGCVDHHEYRAIHKGMTVKQVTHRFHGLHGKTTYQSSLSMSRDYQACGSRFGSVTVEWDKYDSAQLRVGFKSAFWG
jgi:hypothetical protein